MLIPEFRTQIGLFGQPRNTILFLCFRFTHVSSGEPNDNCIT